MFEAGGGILAGLVVGHDDDDFLEAGILRVLAKHLVHLVVLVGGDEEVRIALLAGEARRAGVGADQDHIGLGDRLHDRAEDVGEYGANHEIDLVAVDQGLGLGHGHVGLELVVGDDDLGVAAAELAAEILDRERKAVAQLLAEHRGRARQRGDQADFERLLGVSGANSQCKNRRGGSKRLKRDHVGPPNKVGQQRR